MKVRDFCYLCYENPYVILSFEKMMCIRICGFVVPSFHSRENLSLKHSANLSRNRIGPTLLVLSNYKSHLMTYRIVLVISFNNVLDRLVVQSVALP